MIHLIDLFLHWFTEGELTLTTSWWLDIPVTLAFIVFIYSCILAADRSARRYEERERAIDELINSHNQSE